MLQNTDKIRIENRSNAIVGYSVPETNIVRRFVGKETKEVTMGELRQAIQIPGTFRLIEDNLIIHSQEAVAELLPNAEPEYFYTAEDVDFLLKDGSLDQLRDALDFAPGGVITLIKEEAVKTRLNDMSKREAILEQTGFDVTKAIEIQKLAEVKTETETKTRRAAPVAQDASTSTPEAPVRRAAAHKYTIIK